jgi:hypothetical protein
VASAARLSKFDAVTAAGPGGSAVETIPSGAMSRLQMSRSRVHLFAAGALSGVLRGGGGGLLPLAPRAREERGLAAGALADLSPFK